MNQPPDAMQHALRDVIGHCIYGVDINPMAVELCKVSLWMEALEPGKPLSFLDHRIQCGNSLLGTTPALMANGIPDDAFKPIEGDDKSVVTRAAQAEPRGTQAARASVMQHGLLVTRRRRRIMATLAADVHALDALDDDTLAGVRAKEAQLPRAGRRPRIHHGAAAGGCLVRGLCVGEDGRMPAAMPDHRPRF